MKTLRAPAVVMMLLAGMTVIAACGSDTASTAAGPLTKLQFISKGNKICEEALEEKDRGVEEALKSAQREATKESRQESLEKLAQEVVIPSYERVPEELSQVGAPTGEEQIVQKLIGRFESGLQAVEDEPSRLISNNPFESADRAAQAYGLTACVL